MSNKAVTFFTSFLPPCTHRKIIDYEVDKLLKQETMKRRVYKIQEDTNIGGKYGFQNTQG